MEFVTSKEIFEILESLRKSQLGWIADEIQERIREGKISSLETQKKDKERLVEPYSDDEQLKIVMKTIRSYTVNIFNTWKSAEASITSLCCETDNKNIDSSHPGTPFSWDRGLSRARG